jgi:GR25 family glycosyltransferase involved in LPS biosynthesis
MLTRLLFFALLLFCIPGYSYRTEEPTRIYDYLVPIEIRHPSSGMPIVDCIYLINLDERPDRLARISTDLERHQLFANRVSAVNGWKLSDEDLKLLSKPYGIKMGRGHYGCLLSHLSALVHAQENNFEVIWVLEDDAEFLQDPSCLPALIKELNRVDPKWDLLFTDRDFRDANGKYVKAMATNARPDQPIHPLSYYLRKERVSPHLIKIHNRYATHSMIISKRGIQKLVDYFTHVYIWQPIDIDMHYIPGFREYTTKEDIVSNYIQRDDSNTVSPVKLASESNKQHE